MSTLHHLQQHQHQQPQQSQGQQGGAGGGGGSVGSGSGVGVGSSSGSNASRTVQNQGRSTPAGNPAGQGQSVSGPSSSRSHNSNNEEQLFSADFLHGWDPTRQSQSQPQPQSQSQSQSQSQQQHQSSRAQSQHQSGYSSGTNNNRDQDVAVGSLGVSAADLDLVSSLGVELDHNDDDDDEDDEEENTTRDISPNKGIGGGGGQQQHQPRKHKKGGGRPRDFIWKFYMEGKNNEGKTQASCKACGWTAEQPKAFRMRQHVLGCDGILDADKNKVNAMKIQKEMESAKRAAQRKNGEKVPRNRSRARANVFGNNDEDDDDDDEEGSPSSIRGLLATAGDGVDDEYAYPAVSQVSFLTGGASGSSGTSNKRKRKSNIDTTFQSPALFSNMEVPTRKSPITCHVLDSSAGKPGANIKIRMDQLGTTGFNHVASGETDSDGRANQLLSGNRAIEPGSIFKLTFYTREYFSAKQIKCFHPFVEITFEVEEPKEHYHVALLISPFSYTTYRGS